MLSIEGIERVEASGYQKVMVRLSEAVAPRGQRRPPHFRRHRQCRGPRLLRLDTQVTFAAGHTAARRRFTCSDSDQRGRRILLRRPRQPGGARFGPGDLAARARLDPRRRRRRPRSGALATDVRRPRAPAPPTSPSASRARSRTTSSSATGPRTAPPNPARTSSPTRARSRSSPAPPRPWSRCGSRMTTEASATRPSRSGSSFDHDEFAPSGHDIRRHRTDRRQRRPPGHRTADFPLL